MSEEVYLKLCASEVCARTRRNIRNIKRYIIIFDFVPMLTYCFFFFFSFFFRRILSRETRDSIEYYKNNDKPSATMFILSSSAIDLSFSGIFTSRIFRLKKIIMMEPLQFNGIFFFFFLCYNPILVRIKLLRITNNEMRKRQKRISFLFPSPALNLSYAPIWKMMRIHRQNQGDGLSRY